MAKVAMQLESKVETMKHKPTILKKVIAYIPFITKYVFLYLFMYLFICLCQVLVLQQKIFVLS